MESEFKLDVPEHEAQRLWEHLQSEFETEKLERFLPGLESRFAEEVFYDEYYDDPAYSLAAMEGGVRLRKRFISDTLARQLLQFKLASDDTTGVAREEIKFDVNDKLDPNDRRAMHPFWRYVKPADRGEVNRLLATLRLHGDELQPTVSLKQIRRRLYVQENGEALMTITLDEVSATDSPRLRFTELEMELNEVRYTLADDAERARMEAMNLEIKAEILSQFPSLKQDQTPKYNKMLLMEEIKPWKRVLDNLAYGILASLMFAAVVVFFRYENNVGT